jgi:hypothetical protein
VSRSGRPLVALDHADLVLVAAEVLAEDPDDVLDGTDVAVLWGVASRLQHIDDLAEAAAEVLVAVAAGRPFPNDDAAIAWLATVVLVERNDHTIGGDADEWVAVVRGAADGTLVERDVAEALAAALRPRIGRFRRLLAAACEPRETPVPPTHPCPACRAEVDRSALWSFPAWAVPTDLELTAACARLRGTHGRKGEPLAERRDAAPAPTCPVVLGAAHDGIAPFVALTDRGPLAFRPVGDRSAFDVLALDELNPSDLVGTWSSLWARGRIVSRVPASACRIDDDLLDWSRAAEAMGSTSLVPA